jgi:hypothetical protein
VFGCRVNAHVVVPFAVAILQPAGIHTIVVQAFAVPPLITTVSPESVEVPPTTTLIGRVPTAVPVGTPAHVTTWPTAVHVPPAVPDPIEIVVPAGRVVLAGRVKLQVVVVLIAAVVHANVSPGTWAGVSGVVVWVAVIVTVSPEAVEVPPITTLIGKVPAVDPVGTPVQVTTWPTAVQVPPAVPDPIEIVVPAGRVVLAGRVKLQVVVELIAADVQAKVRPGTWAGVSGVGVGVKVIGAVPLPSVSETVFTPRP